MLNFIVPSMKFMVELDSKWKFLILCLFGILSFLEYSNGKGSKQKYFIQ